MPIYEFGPNSIARIEATTFAAIGLLERHDIQRLLREDIGVIAPDTMVIAEEYAEWTDSKRRIDLLALDKEANLVVIELKRTEDGGNMDLQAVRYAAMVSRMRFEQAVNVYSQYLSGTGKSGDDAGQRILDFLGWPEPLEDKFAKDVRIVLASAEFSKELTSTVLWLNARDLDIRCVRLRPYKLDGRILVDVQQVIPLPEAREYLVQVREKERKEREARESARDYTRYDVGIGGSEWRWLNKRNAIFVVCKTLCGKGISPESVASVIGSPSVWFTVDGELDADAFREKAKLAGRSFDASRWFCKNAETVHYEGHTFALSNQWGADSWLQAMVGLRTAYPAFNITFTPSNHDDDDDVQQ